MISKVTSEERAGKGVTGLPDTPELTTMQMQNQFDSLGNLSIDALNRVADQLNGTEAGNSGADNLGATVPDGVVASETIQSIINALAARIVAQGETSHSHNNKTVLDKINVETKTAYDRLVMLFFAITTIQSEMTNSNAAIPTSAGVYRLLSSFDYQQLKLNLFPIGSVYFSYVSTSPETFIGGVWERVNLISGVLSWRRTA